MGLVLNGEDHSLLRLLGAEGHCSLVEGRRYLFFGEDYSLSHCSRVRRLFFTGEDALLLVFGKVRGVVGSLSLKTLLIL